MTKKSLISFFVLTFAFSSSLLGMGLSDTPDKIEKSRKIRQNAESSLEKVSESSLLRSVELSIEIKGDERIYPTQTGTINIPPLGQGPARKQDYVLEMDPSLLVFLNPSALLDQQIDLDQCRQEPPVSVSASSQKLVSRKPQHNWSLKCYNSLYQTLKEMNDTSISYKHLAEKLKNTGVQCTERSLKSRISRILSAQISPSKMGQDFHGELVRLLNKKMRRGQYKKK